MFLRESEHTGSAGSLRPRHGAGGLRGPEDRTPDDGRGPGGRGDHDGLGDPRQLSHPGPGAGLPHQILPGQAPQDQGKVDTKQRKDNF